MASTEGWNCQTHDLIWTRVSLLMTTTATTTMAPMPMMHLAGAMFQKAISQQRPCVNADSAVQPVQRPRYWTEGLPVITI